MANTNSASTFSSVLLTDRESSDIAVEYTSAGVNDSNITQDVPNIYYETLKLYTTPEAYIVPIIFGLIFIVGITGNAVLIYIVARNKVMRNIPNIYIVSLSIGDLLLILVSVPFTATVYTFTIWPYGLVLCKVNEFLQSVSLGVSVFTLTALSADRYKAIVDPMSKHMGAPLAKTAATASLIWLTSILLAIPDVVGATIIRKPFKINENITKIFEICELQPASWGPLYTKTRVVLRFLVYFAIPMLIIAMFYLLMARVLILSSHNMPGEGKKNKQMMARKKVAKMVLSFVFIFVVCWLPRHVYLLWYYFDPSLYNLFWHIFKIFGFCLAFINSCVNPMALYFLSKQFRKYYNRYLFCRSGKKTSGHEMYSTVRRTSTTMTMMQSQTVC